MHPLTLRGPHFGSFFHHLPEVSLEILRGRAKSKLRKVESTVYLIGAAGDCDLVLGDPQFDSVHCYLLRTPERVTIRRVGTGPELTVDGNPTDNAPLEDGSRLRMGPYDFRLHVRWPLRQPTDSTSDGVALAGEELNIEPALSVVGQLLADIREAVFPHRPGISVYLPRERTPGIPPAYPPIMPSEPLRRAV